MKFYNYCHTNALTICRNMNYISKGLDVFSQYLFFILLLNDDKVVLYSG